MNVLGISANDRESACCLLLDRRLVAAADYSARSASVGLILEACLAGM